MGREDASGEDDAELYQPGISLLLEHPSLLRLDQRNHGSSPASSGQWDGLPKPQPQGLYQIENLHFLNPINYHCVVSLSLFLSTHLLDVFDTLLIREKNHLQTERHSGLAYLSTRRRKSTLKDELISSKCGTSTHAHTLCRVSSSAGKAAPAWDSPHPRRPTEGSEGRKACVESAPREQGSLAPASPHPRHSLSERHNYLGSWLTMQIPRPPDVLYPNVRWGLRICIYELPQIIRNAHEGLASTVQPCPPSWRDWPSLPGPLGGP